MENKENPGILYIFLVIYITIQTLYIFILIEINKINE